MSSFEYVMVLVSIVIGLAITHVLTAVSAAVHRIRGHGTPLRLESVYLLWIGFVLIWLVSFWWFEFKFQDIDIVWSLGLYLFILSYAVYLFLLAAVLVPHRMEGVENSYDYFMEGRTWFLGGILLLIGVDFADGLLKGADWGLRSELVVQYGVFAASAIAGLLSDRRGVQLMAASASLVILVVYLFVELGILGTW